MMDLFDNIELIYWLDIFVTHGIVIYGISSKI